MLNRDVGFADVLCSRPGPARPPRVHAVTPRRARVFTQSSCIARDERGPADVGLAGVSSANTTADARRSMRRMDRRRSVYYVRHDLSDRPYHPTHAGGPERARRTFPETIRRILSRGSPIRHYATLSDLVRGSQGVSGIVARACSSRTGFPPAARVAGVLGR